MKLKLKTELLQNMTAKAIKGASNNTGLYITQPIGISLSDHKLTMTTTDGSNYLYVSEDRVVGEDFSVVVPVDKFAKLISKLTCEDVQLELTEPKKGKAATIVIHGNGKYVIELPYDEDGQLVEFPNPLSEADDATWDTTELKLSLVKLILGTAKASLLVGVDDSCYSSYYCGEKIVATDSFKICGIDVATFDDPKLISPDTMDLLDLMTGETIEVRYNSDTVIFTDANILVYSKSAEGIEEYKIDDISSLLDENFASYCQIDKSLLMQTIDRLSLFVDMFDKNGVYLTFTKDGLSVDNKQANGSELIPYKKSSKFKAFTCCVDIELFRSQVKSTPSELITLYYGKESSIKFVDGNVVQILSLANDDRKEASENEK